MKLNTNNNDMNAFVDTDVSENIILGGCHGQSSNDMPMHQLATFSFHNTHRSHPDDNGYSVFSDDFYESYVENWLISSDIVSGNYNTISYRHGGNYMAGVASFKCEDVRQFNQKVVECYLDTFACIKQLGYQQLVRMWNFIPDIHQHGNDLDRYQEFCQARHSAFESEYRNFESILPAATAVGVNGESFNLHFIATSQPVLACENSRQCAAYHYPVQYGPKSPTFSRATLLKEPVTILYISGTASVVGYESTCKSDVLAQINETMLNILSLLKEVNEKNATNFNGLSSLTHVRVYVRNQGQKNEIKEIVRRLLPKKTHIVVMVADICREELLVEIEAIAKET